MSGANGAGPVRAKSGAVIHEHRLDNGMRVLLVERHLDPVVAVMMWYGVGARNEREDEAGVSHFLEHMMFKGSGRFGKGEVDRITTSLGGSNNAFTSSDHTAYWFEFASDRWEASLDIEADRMQNLALDPDEFGAERAVVLEELSIDEDDPWRHLSRQVQELVYPRHPYGRPVIGYAQVLERMSVDLMRSYYERFYHPGNATVVLCGDFDPTAALEAVRSRFESIPAGMPFEQADCYRARLGEPRSEKRITTHWDDGAARLCMGWPTVSVGSDDDFALDLATTVLSTGRLSRLHRSLVLERGLATSVSTSNDTRRDGGAFWLYAECVEGVDPGELEAAIDDEFSRLASEAAGDDELERAKAVLAAAEAYDWETVTDLAEDIGSYAVDAHWRLALEATERRARVTAAEVQSAAARLLTPGRRVLGWSLPKETAAEDGA